MGASPPGPLPSSGGEEAIGGKRLPRFGSPSPVGASLPARLVSQRGGGPPTQLCCVLCVLFCNWQIPSDKYRMGGAESTHPLATNENLPMTNTHNPTCNACVCRW